MDDLDAVPGIDFVDIVLEDDRWEDAGLPAMAERAARAVGDWLELGQYQVVVLGCDDARIAELNAEFRGKPKPTNVLSWPAEFSRWARTNQWYCSSCSAISISRRATRP